MFFRESNSKSLITFFYILSEVVKFSVSVNILGSGYFG